MRRIFPGHLQIEKNKKTAVTSPRLCRVKNDRVSTARFARKDRAIDV